MAVNSRWVLIVFLLGVTIAGWGFPVVEADAIDRTVGSSPCTYATINGAISAAGPEDRLLIEGGTVFFENVVVNKNLIIEGGYGGCGSGSTEATIVNGGSSGSVVTINRGLSVTLENMVITDGNTGSEGGGIRFAVGSTTEESSLVLTDVAIRNNSGWWGGGLWVGSGSEVVGTNLDISHNSAGTFGGGIRVYDNSTLTLTNADISNNSALDGGGLSVSGADTELTFSGTISNNIASQDGGAIHLTGGTVALDGAWTVSGNSATGNGGALMVSGTGVASLRAVTGPGSLTDNTAGGQGGAICLKNNTSLKIYATNTFDLNVLDNQSAGNGGALFADAGGYFDLYGQVVIDGNRASGNGGAVYLENGSRIWFDDYVSVGPRILNNWASNGGAVYAVGSPHVECDGAVFGNSPLGNYTVNGSGGAMYLSGSELDADNCKFYNNKAIEHGGAIAAFSSSVTIYATCTSPAAVAKDFARGVSIDKPMATPCNPAFGEACSSLHNNVADSTGSEIGDGGAIYSSDGNLTIRQTHLHHNSAYRGGAILQTGATAEANVSNSLIHHNVVAFAFGAGIRRDNGVFNITHTTIADNIGGSGFSGTATSATNTIAWGNMGFPGFAGVPLSSTCNIDDGGNAGVNIDPQFRSPGSQGDYRLRFSSPAKDACAAGLEIDLDNRLRPNGGLYDMGAYEFYSYQFNPALMAAIMIATEEGRRAQERVDSQLAQPETLRADPKSR